MASIEDVQIWPEPAALPEVVVIVVIFLVVVVVVVDVAVVVVVSRRSIRGVVVVCQWDEKLLALPNSIRKC